MKKQLEILISIEVIEFLDSQDWDDLIPRMEAYTLSRISGLKKYSIAKTPLDLVHEIIEKLYSGDRQLKKEDFPNFKLVMFGMLKSHISNFLSSEEVKKAASTDSIEHNVEYENGSLMNKLVSDASSPDELIDIRTKKKNVLEQFKSLNPEDIEVDILECWLDEVTDRKDVSSLLEISTTDYDKYRKRVVRKLNKVNG